MLFFVPFCVQAQVLTPPDPNYSENPDTVIDGAYNQTTRTRGILLCARTVG